MFEQATTSDSRSNSTDWLLRGAVAIAFVNFGIEKFTGPQWVKLFGQMGFGQWFRSFTGMVEIGAALLTLIPRTAQAGLALLAATMGAATLIWIFVLRVPPNSIITGAFCVALALFFLSRR